MTPKKVIVITGPTASGKSAIALSLAAALQTSIISADSRQCFREMTIGTAKPSSEELAAVKHYFINSHSIHDPVNAGAFASYALNAANKIFESNDLAVMAGGTGLYIKAFCEGLDEIPSIPNEIRRQITVLYEQKGMEWLRSEVSAQDPVYYSEGEINNPQRLMRALEVKLGTGRSIRDFQQRSAAIRDFEIIKYAIEVPREQLYNNINGRVDKMIQEGLVGEVQSLLPYKHLNALQTVGYAELFDYFDGLTSLDKAIETIKINTRHYAKRQMTWFRKDPTINWIASVEEIRI